MEQKQYEVLRGFMNHLTKDCLWYCDTPEKRFERTSESIWLVNPKTKKWVLKLTKDGRLIWSYVYYVSFQRFFNMEESDYEKFIKIWVEDILNREVSLTQQAGNWVTNPVEDVLNRGVSSTRTGSRLECELVEYVLRGVSTTIKLLARHFDGVEDVLKNGKTIQ